MINIRTLGAELCVDLQGAPLRAVFVHGFGGDLHSWDGLWSELSERVAAEGYGLLRYDLRGFGQSAAHNDVSFNHADDLLAVLDVNNIQQADLIGASMGGGIALNFALDHPERVRNLVLISPSLVAWEWSATWNALWQPIIEHARQGDMDQARRLWWEHPLFSTTRNSAAGPALHASILRYTGQQWLHDDHQLMLPDVERLHLLDVRTLLLTGGRDLDDFRLIAALIAASASNLQRIDHPTLGHLLHLEDPATCAAEISEFLTAQ